LHKNVGQTPLLNSYADKYNIQTLVHVYLLFGCGYLFSTEDLKVETFLVLNVNHVTFSRIE